MERNLVVYNDNTGISEKMGALFAGESIHMQVAGSLEELLSLMEEGRMHLVLIDVELDGKGWCNGIEVLAHIRKKSSIPIIVVSAQSAETAKIMALNAGADDYVVAGCNPLELLARVKCQLRRYNQLVNMCSNIDRIYRVDGLVVQERGRVLSISQIYESIWHMQAIGADNTIAVHIRHIREKIEQNPKEPYYLKVVWGTGYKVG